MSVSRGLKQRPAPDRDALLALLLPFTETDVLCYRSDASPELAAKQAEVWDPLIDWARARYDVTFAIMAGIRHVAQPPATVAQLRAALETFDTDALPHLHALITIGGSVVVALMVAERAIDADAAFDACHLDELWQAQLWGEDDFAAKSRAHRRAAFAAAAEALSATVSA